MSAPTAFSQTTWDRGGGTSAWSTATNWNPDTEPGTLNPVIFPATIPGAAPGITLSAGELASTLEFNNDYALSGGNLTLGTGTITTAAGTSSSISSVLQGSAVLTKTGTGTLTLSGANTYSGGTVVSQGTLILSAAGAGPSTAAGTGTITLGDGSSGSNPITLLLNDVNVSNNVTVSTSGTGTVSIGSTATSTGNSLPNYSGTLTLNRATTLIANEFDRFHVGGVITGNVGLLTIDGGHRVTFGGTNTFTGDILVKNNSILQLGVVSAPKNFIPDTSSVTVETGSAFRLSTSAETINGLNGGGNIANFSAPTAPVLTVGAGNADGSYSGVISTSVSLVKTGTGTQTLSGSNTYTGTTTIQAGTLLLGADNTLSDNSAVVLAGGKLDTGGYSDAAGALSMTASSVIDLGSGSSVLSFASLGSLAGGTLSIWNWSGTEWQTGGTDRLLFTTGTVAEYSNVQFYSDSGSTLIGPGRLIPLAGGGFELIGVPEPTALASVLALGAAATRRRRQRPMPAS